MTQITLEEFYALKPVIACLLLSLVSKPNPSRPGLKTQYPSVGIEKIHYCKICVKTHLAIHNYCLLARVRLTTVQSVETFRGVENAFSRCNASRVSKRIEYLESLAAGIDRFRAADRPHVRVALFVAPFAGRIR